MLKKGNCSVLNTCGFPLIIVRYPCPRKATCPTLTQDHFDNQFAKTMLIDVHTGITPEEWQTDVGPVLAYRPQIVGEIPKHFGSLDFSIISEFMKINMFGNETANQNLTFEKLKKFADNHCADFTLSQLAEQNILNEEF